MKGLPVKKDVTTKTIDPYFAAYIQDVPWRYVLELRNSLASELQKEVPKLYLDIKLEVSKSCITPVAGTFFLFLSILDFRL